MSADAQWIEGLNGSYQYITKDTYDRVLKWFNEGRISPQEAGRYWTYLNSLISLSEDEDGEYRFKTKEELYGIAKNDNVLKQGIDTAFTFALFINMMCEKYVAAGLFCRKMDGRFCRKKPDTDVRRAGRIDVAGVFCRTREGRGQSRSLH